MFVVVNFDALAQASDIQIERRQVVFLYWMQIRYISSLQLEHYIHTYIIIKNSKKTNQKKKTEKNIIEYTRLTTGDGNPFDRINSPFI